MRNRYDVSNEIGRVCKRLRAKPAYNKVSAGVVGETSVCVATDEVEIDKTKPRCLRIVAMEGHAHFPVSRAFVKTPFLRSTGDALDPPAVRCVHEREYAFDKAKPPLPNWQVEAKLERHLLEGATRQNEATAANRLIEMVNDENSLDNFGIQCKMILIRHLV
jgi:hypothetical protein